MKRRKQHSISEMLLSPIRIIVTIIMFSWTTKKHKENISEINEHRFHYDDVIMTTIASQITSLTVVCSIVYSGVDQRKHQSSASLAFVRGIHRDRWIPRKKGQLRGKCFHLMTSSCSNATSAPDHNRIDADSISLSAVYFWPMFDVNP